MVVRKEQAYRVAPNRLASDTEESIVGTEWHQEAISALAIMLGDAAERRGARWGVCEQIELGGLHHYDGTAYDPRPDVMVLAQPFDGRRSSIHIVEAGAPLFIAEIASASTVRNDLGDKRTVYEAIGAAEYLVFDPLGDLLDAPVRAWRLPPGSTAYQPWLPEPDGSWRSQSLDVSLIPDRPFLVVRDRDGYMIPHPRTAGRRIREAEQAVFDAQERAREAEQAALDVQERAREAEERIRELEEQLRRLRAAHPDDPQGPAR